MFTSWFSGGPKEPAPENEVYLSQSDDGGESFSAPHVMAGPKDGARCYDPTLWIDPKGRLWYVFNRSNKDAAKHDVWARICDDPDATPPVFGAEFRVGYDAPFAFRMNKPTVLSTGEWLMPVTHAAMPIKAWSTGYNESQEPTLHGVGISTDEGRTWKLHGALKSKPWALENMIVELKDGRLWMLIRTTRGFFWESFSSDVGKTWSEAKATNIDATSAPGHLTRLTDGRIALVWNCADKKRAELHLAFSADEGKTWTPSAIVAQGKPGGATYPFVIENVPGELWIGYHNVPKGWNFPRARDVRLSVADVRAKPTK